jgi:magnesium transporter
VVDEDHRLVGIITHDDVIDVVREEAEEDAYRMAAMAPMAEDYLEAPISTVWKKRAAWLACLFVAELFTFTALAFFEEAIASVLVLSLFVPLCISVGGNSGSQAATLITRAMALGYVGPAAWWRVLRHELLMGVLLGATLGTIGFVRGLTTPQSLLDSTEVYESTLEVRIPTGAKLISSESGYALAPGFQIMAESVDRPAVVTTPGGIEPQWVEAAGGQTIYRFPPNSQIRFPAPIRWPLAAVIAASVAAICLWGTLVGAMLPLAFSRLGFDPGYASSPFVATFVDVTGIVIYFSIAHLWLL